ncbi:MAG: ATP-binding cassette domain-containing protein [Bacteroidales bacterium]|jgi:ABC-2 type transport system ATP-binding protein|nr:ATP-binding cassette domain-containing protein [Bacteroidales bacterium]
MIEIKNLTFGYNKHRNIVENMTLNIKEGYVHGLLGKNGTGKTTLLSLISGLLFAEKGEINVDNFTPKERKVDFLSEIFFLPEEFDEIRIRIDSYVKVNAAFYPRFSYTDFKQYLEEFEISDCHQKLSKLSYGTKKKVFIAFGLATHAKYLFFDEPTNGLDIPSKVQFRKIILKAMADNQTIIISTHQVRDLHNLIDNIIIMDKANILMNASVGNITEKLWFGLKDKCESDVVLYEEENVGGKMIVAQNTTSSESNLDIELLFNAAFQSRDKFNELFNNLKQ